MTPSQPRVPHQPEEFLISHKPCIVFPLLHSPPTPKGKNQHTAHYILRNTVLITFLLSAHDGLRHSLLTGEETMPLPCLKLCRSWCAALQQSTSLTMHEALGLISSIANKQTKQPNHRANVVQHFPLLSS